MTRMGLLSMGNFINYLAFSFFVVGAIGGIYALVRDLIGKPRRVEVHHRYHAVPTYYGPGAYRGAGRPGDMGHFSPNEADNGEKIA